LERARKNAEKAGATNAEFLKGRIESLPLPDASTDCIISNCVINLAPDKRAVFREMARVLKPGGRVAVSDIALKKPLPPELGEDLLAYVGCISGAIPIEEYREGLLEAGFAHVEIIDSGADLNAYAKIEDQVGCCGGEMASGLPVVEAATCCTPTRPVPEGEECCTTAEEVQASEAGASCCSPAPAASQTSELLGRLAEIVRLYDINDFAASVKVFAVKA